jgi:protein phosphatase
MLEFDHAGLSEQGPVRENNEDFISHCHPTGTEAENNLHKGSIFVIADGVGGNRAGEVASREAAQFLLQAYYSKSQKPAKAFREAFNETNLHIHDLGHSKPEYRQMETTLSALCLVGNQYYLGHIGDSRVYQVRGSEIKQLTSDHSEVGELLRMRLLTAEEARHHPRRNIITRSIGSELLMKADFLTEPLEVGDIFILCTDGLWEPLEDNDIAEIVNRLPAAEACRTLVELALERGTSDNLSIQVIKVLQLGQVSQDLPERKNGLFKKAFRFLSTQE